MFFLLLTFLIITLMLPLGKADPDISVTPSENHHIPEVSLGGVDGAPAKPYMAGWMDTGDDFHFGVKQTRVTVSFPNTNPSVIQTNNWLAGGMFVTGYDSTLHQIDYGFFTILVLDNYGNLYLDVGVWKTYEALFPYPQGIFPWTTLLYSATWSIGGVSPSTPVTQTARWDASSGLIYWDLQVPGNAPITLDPVNMTALASTIIPSFNVGIVDLWKHAPPAYLWAPYMLAYDFQFGVYSNYNIGQGGWNVKLEYPQYYKDNRWYYVDTAKSIGGANAYLDARYRWGGGNYAGVNAYYYKNQPSLGRHKIVFYYSGSSLSDNTLLWTQNDADKGIDAGNSWGSATLINLESYYGELYQTHDTNDWYQFYVSKNQEISASMTPPAGVNFDLQLYDDEGYLRAGSYAGAGYTDKITYNSDVSGYWRIRIYTVSGGGTYSFHVTTPGGGGCPYVSTWDGDKYALDNNILPVSEFFGETDITDHYLLQQILAQRQDGTYSLLLSEFENEHSFFDQVQLLAVDHPSNVRIGVSPYGEIFTYTNSYPPKSAIDDNNRNIKDILNSIDGNYYEGYNGSYIALNFGDEFDVGQGAKLVIRSDAEMKSPVYIQTMDSMGEWKIVATIYTRTYWSTDVIDLSGHLPDARGKLKVRLYFISNDKIDFVGLDTSSQTTLQIQEGQLVSAIHSGYGDITAKLLYSDEIWAELVPSQEIQLSFTLPSQTMEARSYIIIVEGHYYTIDT